MLFINPIPQTFAGKGKQGNFAPDTKFLYD
jgi:hypothetical protein